MKYYTRNLFFAACLCVLVFGACKTGDTPDSGSSTTRFDGDTSYALGMDMGSSLKENGIIPDAGAFFKGFKDALRGKTRFTVDEAGEKIQQAIVAMRDKENEPLKKAEADFLAENKKKPGIIVTASGLQYEVIYEGSGEKPSESDTVKVNYEGVLADGTVFDSSYERGEPVEFPLMGVIPGWREGLQLMSVGSTYKLYIPSELAYGPAGAGQVIPPYSPLTFEVELLEIVEDE
jgi:FKBP-type peptidyl-prolyl cis-trans isomerase